ncbi:aldolase/citrate lyase family protein [Flavobacteriales bacterium]|nr:aldolase/citrate lyase family protein [Flavobacteriales bacterium]
MKLSITPKEKENILGKLGAANLMFQEVYPGDRPDRQPVHTVYGGADLFSANAADKMGKAALNTLLHNAPNFVVMAKAIEIQGHEHLPEAASEIQNLVSKLDSMSDSDRKKHPAWLAYTTYAKVVEKLKVEALEDFRIDFEDGFGNRSWEEEDATAERAALEVAKGMKSNSLPPFIGIRIKPFTEDLKERGTRTLDIFLTTLAAATNGKLPDNFVVMLPKVSIPEQIEALIELFEVIEKNTTIPSGSLKMEMMVETTQSIISKEGTNPLKSFVEASKGRMIATAFGTYDYTASCNITAKYQDMGHAVCDFAHHFMKVALGATGIWLSDGATNVMPIGPHRGAQLSPAQLEENKAVVHKNWKIAFEHTRYSLWKGLYQGWDLNPAQFPMRYAAVYSFFLESYEDAAIRLKSFVERAARATLTSDVFDDAATGQGLLNYFLRGLNCGAITTEEALATGLTIKEIQTRSFLKILEGRRINS